MTPFTDRLLERNRYPKSLRPDAAGIMRGPLEDKWSSGGLFFWREEFFRGRAGYREKSSNGSATVEGQRPSREGDVASALTGC